MSKSLPVTLAAALLLSGGTAAAGGFSDFLKDKLDATIEDAKVDVIDSVQRSLRDTFPAVSKMSGMEPVPADYGDKVTVFGFQGCPYCRELTRFLRDNDIEYVNMDVEKNPAAKREFRRLGGRGVPLTVVNSESVGGFSEGSMRAFLAKHGVEGV